MSKIEIAPPTKDFRDDFAYASRLVATAWLVSSLAGGLPGFSLNFLLKDGLHLTASSLALFALFGNVAGYVKPLMGIVVDAFPLFGTRWRHYLMFAFAGSGLCYFLMGVVPRTFGSLLATNILLFVCLNLGSIVMGGMMVEVGQRHKATGRMSAQRVAISRLDALVSTPIGAWLAFLPFSWVMTLPALIYFATIPIFYRHLREPKTTPVRSEVLQTAKRQLHSIAHCRPLLIAASAVMLIVMAPGFGTPLFYYQTDVLHFSKGFLGSLSFVGGAFGILGAAIYVKICRRFSLKTLLIGSILVHAGGTLFYLGYHTPASALAITALEGIAQTLAVLPLYDLAARATPRGSEALGYALMMSAWNLTIALSNWFGSWLSDQFGLTFLNLVWLNAGTTALALVIIPLLPAILVQHREEEKKEALA